jgi:hypothetical protein
MVRQMDLALAPRVAATSVSILDLVDHRVSAARCCREQSPKSQASAIRPRFVRDSFRRAIGPSRRDIMERAVNLAGLHFRPRFAKGAPARDCGAAALAP